METVASRGAGAPIQPSGGTNQSHNLLVLPDWWSAATRMNATVPRSFILSKADLSVSPGCGLASPRTGIQSLYQWRHLFVSILPALLDSNGSTARGQWVDIDFKNKAEQDTLSNQPTLTGWLPNSNLLPQWQSVHNP